MFRLEALQLNVYSSGLYVTDAVATPTTSKRPYPAVKIENFS